MVEYLGAWPYPIKVTPGDMSQGGQYRLQLKTMGPVRFGLFPNLKFC